MQNANLLHVSFFLILTRALKHVVCLGESRLSEVNNSPRANVFPAGVANFGKAMYRSLERSTQDTRDGFFLYSAQASFSWPRVDLARLLRRAYSRPFWITSFEFAKVCGILGKLHWFLHLLLSYYYDSGMFIFCWSSNFVEKVVLNERMSAKMASPVSPAWYIIIVYSVNLNKLSRNLLEH